MNRHKAFIEVTFCKLTDSLQTAGLRNVQVKLKLKFTFAEKKPG